MSDLIPIRFEDRIVTARRGEPLAAALAAAGILALRTTRTGAERGLFCGMGVCQDCLVEIDGQPHRRACMEKVDRPLTVRREAHGRPLPPATDAPPPVLIDDLATERPELLVVGAGPGGLSAALAARRAGLEVLLLDERPVPGGQYFKQSAVSTPIDAQQRRGAALVDEVRVSGVEMRAGVPVWGAMPPLGFVATVDGATRIIEPGAAIVATGAMERAWPVPGWTLPGVMTTGAAQTLWRTAGRLPGRRVLIAGNGPLNLQLAQELAAGGAEIVAVAEAAPQPGPEALPDLARMALSAPQLLMQGARMAMRLGGRLRHETHIARIERVEGGLAVTLAGGRPGVLTADIVCLGYGFQPAGELLRLLDAEVAIDPAGRRAIARDADGGTSVPGLFAIGDCTGLGGAHAALAEGLLAGLAAAEWLGRALSPALLRERRRARAALARHRRFQAALWRLHATPVAAPSTPDTILCRCEEVTFGQVAAARDTGLGLIGAIKQETRCGMGRCQGRYCAPILEDLVGGPATATSGFAPRMPVIPVAIGDLGA